MNEFEFTIVASGLDPSADDFADRFYDAGCDDATVSFQKGRIIVDFAREAISLEAAIASAVANVETAGATVERIEPDPLVSLSDIAARTDLTRSAVSNYASGLRGQGFPAPVARVTSESPLWHWIEVAQWLYDQKRVGLDVVMHSFTIDQANLVLDAGYQDFSKELHGRIVGEMDQQTGHLVHVH
jgi:hypothetical protein